MISPQDFYQKAEAVRLQTIEILGRLEEKAKAFELPPTPEVLTQQRQRLIENEYKVLVVGEAKRGKSTFVNALIGRDILPTDVDVATSQVFRIRQAETEAYRLRFEDDSEQPIEPADLPRYGSQVVQDAQGEPALNQIIRWIEVDVPVRFLPKGVLLLDTPGTGSIYAAHAEITHRFVPLADAVIFVLSSEKMIIQNEIDFVSAILDVTPHIFFIQTKIDRFGDKWEETRQRSLDILREKFSDKLGEAQIYPISSVNLRAAAVMQGGDAEALLMVSRHKELAAALQAFLFRVAGWSRPAEAILSANQYFMISRQTLATRLKIVTDESNQKLQEVQRKALERKRNFESDWGANGSKRRELIEGTRRAIIVGKRRMAEVLQPNQEIYNTIEAKINAVNSIDQANAVGKNIGGEIMALASSEWRQVCSSVHAHCDRLLQPFFEAASAMVVTMEDETEKGLSTINNNPIEQFRYDWFGRIKSGYSDVAVAFGVGTVLAFTPLAPLSIFALAWGIFRAIFPPADPQLENARRELRRHLSDCLTKVKSHFFNADITTNRLSNVDEYFDAFEKNINHQIQTVVQQKSGELQTELNRLNEEAKLDEQKRKAKAAELRGQVAAWEEIGKKMTATANQLEQLK